MDVASVIPDKLKKLFGPSINSADQAAAEAVDPTGFSLALRRPYDPAESDAATADVQVPPSLAGAAKAAAVPPPETAPVPNSLSDVAGVQSSTPDSTQLPKLAPQGSSNGLLYALQRAAGIVDENPKAGELYKGPTTSYGKLAAGARAGMGFLGNLGNAMVMAGGSPTDKELAEKRMELAQELPVKRDLAQAQLKSLGEYRQGRIENAANTNDIKQQQADQVQQQNVAKNRAIGQVPNENSPGTYRSMTPDEILADPVLSQKQDLAKAAQMQKDAEARLAQAHVDTIRNGNTAAYQQAERKIQATLEMARANLALRQHSLANNDARLNMQEQQMLFNYGANGNQVLDQSNAAPGMLMNGEQVVPYKQNSSFAPTANMRTMQQMAQTMPVHIQELRGLIDEADQKGYIGPVAGRVYQDFLAGKVGTTGNPDADALLGQMRAADSLVSSALLRTHFGGRGAMQAYDVFRGLLPSGGTKQLLNGALDEFDSYVKGYSTAGTPQTTGRGAPATNTLPGKPNDRLGIR